MKLNYLRTNWEKILLLCILVFFIISLSWLIKNFYIFQEIKLTGLDVIVNKNPYNIIDASYFDFRVLLSKSVLWTESKKRETDSEDEFYIVPYTDFMKPFPIARSAAPKAEGKLIPYEYYKIGYCPITKEPLGIKEEVEKIDDSIADSDGDGIPDSTEEKYGLSPNFATDADYDMDSDSFTNLQEYLYNPEGINNPKIHPPIIVRLVLTHISQVQLPFVVKKIIKSTTDKKNWNVQINYTDPGVTPSTQFLKIGSAIDLPKLSFKITDIIERTYDRLDPSIRAIVTYDDSIVVFQNKEGALIQAQVNKPIYERDNIVSLNDLYSRETYRIMLGDTIRLGDDLIGTERYLFKKIEKDQEKGQEYLIFEKDSVEYIVGRTTDYKVPTQQK